MQILRQVGLVMLLIIISSGCRAGTIEKLQFHTQSEVAQLDLFLPPHHGSYSVKQESQLVDIEIPGVTLAEKWQHNMDLSASHSCVQAIKGANRAGANLLISLRSGCKVHPVLLNNKLQLLFKPEAELKVLQINLDFQTIPVRSLLHILASSAHINIVVSNAVHGNMTIHLQHVSWQQALAIVLQTQGLAVKKINGAWFVAPQAVILAQEKLNAELDQQTSVNQALGLRYFHLHYADNKSVSYVFKQNFPQAKIMRDSRTSAMIVKAPLSQLIEMEHMLKQIDVPMKQVLIEARIAVIDESALHELGIVMGSRANNLLQRLPPTLSYASIDLPVQQPAGTIGINIAHLPGGQSLDLELQALEAQGHGEIISSPKLLVSDNQKASIEQGDEIPFQTATSSGATQIEYKKAVLGLEVTPHVTSHSQVLLDLQVNNDSIARNETADGQEPILATSKVKTKVLVNNGETVVLGGIHIQEIRHDKRGVPYLDAIPGLGWLFRHSTDINRKTELLVFVTPKIIQ